MKPKITKPNIQIPHEKCSLKVIKTCKISGKFNVTVRLVKTPPLSPYSAPVLKTYNSSPLFTLPSDNLINSNSSMKDSNNDPSDFIEPPQNLAIPSMQEYLKHTFDPEDSELCDTCPIIPKDYAMRPSQAIRLSAKVTKKKVNLKQTRFGEKRRSLK